MKNKADAGQLASGAFALFFKSVYLLKKVTHVTLINPIEYDERRWLSTEE